ncbi:bi-domain-containing oxidoreductase [Janibacter anophelis]|uniref:bi-domain-containing oxidoreductase n=1 Tax=Janibacter anophelis TaxID=319054 RepID=UPI0008309D50|nr:bi-domain-containing oxidoreductase [Janibacter anophelis]
MKQVVQSVGDGSLRVVEVPTPTCGPAEVLVSTTRSLLSTGTEKAVRELASASLIDKAKARPDLVRQVLKKARTEGLRNTVQAVRTRLDEDMPLGYSAAGIVLEVGSSVHDLTPGTRVATASAGHAEAQVVPSLLAVPIPDGVTDEAAAFGAVAAIAMQGLRQADVQFGGTVAVVGLGLVGQLTARLALASGLRVIGVDLRDWTVDLAAEAGAIGLIEEGQGTTDAILAHTRGRGVDAVLVTASTKSSDPVMAAVERVRDRGAVVVVGDVGVELARTPFYMKEVDVRFARSYGPGRYDRTYEEYGIDYPIGHVRWTEGRNIEAYLDMVAGGRLQVDDLVTHVFDIDESERAYETIGQDPKALAVQFSYSRQGVGRDPISLRPIKAGHRGSGIVGAGNYAKMTFLPAMKKAGLASAVAVTSNSGLTARHLAERHDVAQVVADVPSLLAMDSVDTVFVLSRHDSHAQITRDALAADKHVFVEKPLALSEDELESVLEAVQASERVLWGGFNRRHSEAIQQARKTLGGTGEPLVITYRVSAGRLPETHWYKDRRQGGRLLGEVCHFIDLASWVVGMPVAEIVAFGSGGAELVLQEDLVISAKFADGSIATITYAEHGHASSSKEYLDILGRGHTVTIDDFHKLTIDGKEVKLSAPGKGHVENLRLFADAIAGKAGDADTRATIASTAAALAAVQSLEQRTVIPVDPRVGSQPFNN